MNNQGSAHFKELHRMVAGNLCDQRRLWLARDGRRKAYHVVALLVLIVGQRLEVDEIRLRIDLVQLKRHFDEVSFLVLLANADVIGIQDFPFVV